MRVCIKYRPLKGGDFVYPWCQFSLRQLFDKGVSLTDTLGGVQNMTLINNEGQLCQRDERPVRPFKDVPF